MRGHVLYGSERFGQLLVGTQDARAHGADARSYPGKRGQQQGQPSPLIPLDKNIDLLRSEVHEQINDQRIAGQHIQGRRGEITRLESKHTEQHDHQAPGQRQTAVALKVIGNKHNYRDRG